MLHSFHDSEQLLALIQTSLSQELVDTKSWQKFSEIFSDGENLQL